MSTELATRPQASQQLATLIGMDRAAMLDTIKAQCFKTAPGNVSDAQLAAFVSVAAAMEVNPLLPGMLYAYPLSGGGIVPIMGPDGVYKKLTEHPEIDSWETEVFPADVALPPTHATTKIWRKGRERPISFTALLSEWKINNNPNWNTRPRHMIALRSLKHAARQIIHGLPYDEDDRVIMGEVNVTPGAETPPAAAPERAAPPPRKAKGANAVTTPATEPAKNAAVEVVATEVPATPIAAAYEAEKAKTTVQTPPPAPEPAKAKEQPATPPPADTQKEAAPTSRAFLKDGEEYATTVTVTEVAGLVATVKGVPNTPSVKLGLKGGYVGAVYHFGGGTLSVEPAKGDQPEKQVVTPLPVWKVGAQVAVKLRGKLNAHSGKVIVSVDSAEPVAGSVQEEF